MLKTISKSVPEIHDAADAKQFFRDCRSARTVDLKVESVLRRNGFTVPLVTYDLAIAQLPVLGYPKIVGVFLNSAIDRHTELRNQAANDELRRLWHDAATELKLDD